MSPTSLLASLLLPPDTCGTSWQPFLISVSPAVGALLSATALWVASQARSTSKDALQTSQGAVTLSLADSRSRVDTDPPGRHEAPERR